MSQSPGFSLPQILIGKLSHGPQVFTALSCDVVSMSQSHWLWTPVQNRGSNQNLDELPRQWILWIPLNWLTNSSIGGQGNPLKIRFGKTTSWIEPHSPNSWPCLGPETQWGLGYKQPRLPHKGVAGCGEMSRVQEGLQSLRGQSLFFTCFLKMDLPLWQRVWLKSSGRQITLIHAFPELLYCTLRNEYKDASSRWIKLTVNSHLSVRKDLF